MEDQFLPYAAVHQRICMYKNVPKEMKTRKERGNGKKRIASDGIVHGTITPLPLSVPCDPGHTDVSSGSKPAMHKYCAYAVQTKLSVLSSLLCLENL